jgi:hypothetical protein
MSSGVPPSREAITAALDQFDAAQATSQHCPLRCRAHRKRWPSKTG